MKLRQRHTHSLGCVLLLPLFIGMSACDHDAPDQAGTSLVSQAPQKPVRYSAAAEQPIDDRLEIGAKVGPDPTRLFRIFPPASGKILGIQVKPGDMVDRGQTLGTIDSSDAASARSDFAKAKIEVARASSAADREKLLLDHGAIAEKDYIDAKAVADTAVAELARAQQRLQMMDVSPTANTDRIPLLSPARGVVLSVNAAPGEFSKSLDNADPIVTIADLSVIWVVGDVYEKDISNVKVGKQVDIVFDAYPGREFAGRIDSLSGMLDPSTRTLKARVVLKNLDQRLKPEMFASIRVDVGKHNAIVVPSTAVIHEGQTTSVFVESNGKPEKRNVSTGQAIKGTVEITSGLQPGQQVAVNGAELLTGETDQQ